MLCIFQLEMTTSKNSKIAWYVTNFIMCEQKLDWNIMYVQAKISLNISNRLSKLDNITFIIRFIPFIYYVNGMNQGIQRKESVAQPGEYRLNHGFHALHRGVHSCPNHLNTVYKFVYKIGLLLERKAWRRGKVNYGNSKSIFTDQNQTVAG